MTETDVANLALDLLGHTGRLADLATDTTREARLLRNHVPTTRKELLRSCPWNFAITRERLEAVYAAITGAANASGMVRVTSNGHGLSNGARVTVKGSFAFDGSWRASGVTTNTFDLVNSTWTSAGTLGKWCIAPAYGQAYTLALPADCLRVIESNGQKASARHCMFHVERGRIVLDSDVAELRYVADIEDPAEWDDLFRKVYTLRLAAAVCIPLTQSQSRQDGLLQDAARVIADAWQSDALETQSEVIYPGDDNSVILNRYASTAD